MFYYNQDRYLNFLLNAMNTRHFSGEGAAISYSLCRYHHIAPAPFFKWAEQYGHLEQSYIPQKFHPDQPTGMCRVFVPNRKLLEEKAKLDKSLWGRKKIDVVEQTSHKQFITTSVRIEHRDMVEYDIEAVRNLECKKESERIYVQFLLDAYPDGVIPHYYYRNKTGRLTAIGSSLQSAPRRVRNAAMRGKYLYDFEACQQTILSQLYNAPICEDYVKNKSAIRKQLCHETGMTMNEVKQTIQALTFGASLSGNEGTCLEDKIGVITKNEWLSNYAEELETIRREGNIFPYSVNSNSFNWLAHKLQQEESRILDVIRQELRPDLLLYDGWISDEVLDTDHLCALVYEQTGYEMKIAVEQL